MIQVILDDFGMGLYKKSERIVVKKNKETIAEYPFFDVEEIIISTKGVLISTDVIQECMEHGIQIHLSDFREQPYGLIYSPYLHGTVKTRREQVLSMQDKRGVEISRAFVIGKLMNQIRTLKYFMKSRKEEDVYILLLAIIDEIKDHVEQAKRIEGMTLEETRNLFFSVEGRAATYYWTGLQAILTGKAEFTGRKHRDAEDTINMMLNYGYAILGSRILGAIVRAGLEPFAGFLHTDRSGRASLQMDLIEEFRQPVVDRVVVSMFTKGFKPKLDEEGKLDASTRKQLSDKIKERLDTKEEYHGKKYKVGSIIQVQARQLATYFREGQPYKSYAGRW